MQRRSYLLEALLSLVGLVGASLTVAPAVAAPAPSVSAVKPNTGPLSGGNRVTILGSNFKPSPIVRFGKLRATHVTYVSTSKLVVTAPTRAGGSAPLTVDVRVTTRAGTSARVGTDRFSFMAPPSIASITPAAGPVAGGSRVVLKGARFQNVSAVTFGGVAGTSLHRSSATQIEVTAPSHAAGPVTVGMVTPQGKATSHFSYQAPPTLTTVSPETGPLAGGNELTLTGTELAGTRYVTVDDTKLSPTSLSATEVTVQLPAHAAGPVGVSITTWGGQTEAKIYTYAPPAVAGLSPSHGSMRGGTPVTISGSGFSGATAVTFDGTPAATFTVHSDSMITATSPPHSGAGPIDVQVTVPGGQSATDPADEFTYGIIDFTIAAGTGSGPWNTSGSPVLGWVGDVVRFHNADSFPHRLHAAGNPGAHWASDLAPGATFDWALQDTCVIGDVLYDHAYGTSARFYIVVDPPS